MTVGDDDWPEVEFNLKKARNSWGRMLQILIPEGVDPKVSGHFFQGLIPGGSAVWGGYVGLDPWYGEGPNYQLIITNH